MSKKYLFISVSLFISLFIYLFYRTSHTVVNEIIIGAITFSTYHDIKTYIAEVLPLNNMIVYSLPEGLWVFCITLTSKPYFIRLFRWRIDGVYLPLVYCVALEVLQLTHITNGRFDLMDIWVSVVCWLVANYGFREKQEKQEIFTRFNVSMLICLVSYGIVYLAHVTQGNKL